VFIPLRFGDTLADSLECEAVRVHALPDIKVAIVVAVADLECASDELAESMIDRLARRLDAPADMRRELLMGLKEELFDRELQRRPISESEREAICLFLLNYSSLDDGEH
jgi:hypothetical protein